MNPSKRLLYLAAVLSTKVLASAEVGNVDVATITLVEGGARLDLEAVVAKKDC